MFIDLNRGRLIRKLELNGREVNNYARLELLTPDGTWRGCQIRCFVETLSDGQEILIWKLYGLADDPEISIPAPFEGEYKWPDEEDPIAPFERNYDFFHRVLSDDLITGRARDIFQVTAAPTSAAPTSAMPTSATPISAAPTSTAAPPSGTPTSARPTSIPPTLAVPASTGPTSARLASATPTSATPTSAGPGASVPSSRAALPRSIHPPPVLPAPAAPETSQRRSQPLP